MIDGVDAALYAVLIGVNDEIEIEILGRLVAKRDHVLELPGRVDVEHGERQSLRIESLAGKMQQDCRILANRIHQHRLAELGGGLAEDVDAFRFQQIEVREMCGHKMGP